MSKPRGLGVAQSLTSHLSVVSIIGEVQFWSDEEDLLVVRDDSAIVTDIFMSAKKVLVI